MNIALPVKAEYWSLGSLTEHFPVFSSKGEG
jgi:hypothetical protein